MLKRFSFWSGGLVFFQFLTAVLHSVSFFTTVSASNEEEGQLFHLMEHYRADMGGGITRSMNEILLSLSISFVLLCLFGGLTNWYFKWQNLDAKLWKGLLLIEMVIFGALFLVMILLTFWPPIILTGMIFLLLLGSWASLKTN